MRQRIGRFLALALELLRELGDENPYRRHLTAHGAFHSAEQWRAFQDERLRNKYLHAKCC